MPKLTKAGAVENFDWTTVEAESSPDIGALNSGHWLLPVVSYQSLASQADNPSGLGMWLSTDTDPQALGAWVKDIPTIAIHFPVFTDGRGFSLARILREELGFDGELCAQGHFLQDQLYYLKRCGFDAFVVPDDSNLESLRASLNDFSNAYQAGTDQPKPLFRRRAS